MKLQELIDKSTLMTHHFTCTVNMMRSENDHLTFSCDKKYLKDICKLMSITDVVGRYPLRIATPNGTILNGMSCFIDRMTEGDGIIMYDLEFTCVGIINLKILSDNTENKYSEPYSDGRGGVKRNFIGSINVKTYQLIGEPVKSLILKLVKLSDKLTEPEFKAILKHCFEAGFKSDKPVRDFETYYKQMYKD